MRMQSGFFLIGSTLSTKLLPSSLEGKRGTSCQSSGLDKKAWTVRSLFLGWLLLCSVPEIRTYLSSKGLPFKSDKAPGHPKPHEFNSKGLEVTYSPPNTMSLIQPLGH